MHLVCGATVTQMLPESPDSKSGPEPSTQTHPSSIPLPSTTLSHNNCNTVLIQCSLFP